MMRLLPGRPSARHGRVLGMLGIMALMLATAAACDLPGTTPTTIEPGATQTQPATPVIATSTLKPTFFPTSEPSPTATASPAAPKPTQTSTATATRTRIIATGTETATAGRTATATPSLAASRLVLANYFAWYSTHNWDDCNISAGDKPLRLYDSDDPATIATHIHQALDAGIDGFTLQWFAPGERTDKNLGTLLAQSQGTAFRSTVVILRHIWPGTPGPSHSELVRAIRYLLDRYGSHPNFLSLEGRPVLFFANMESVPVAAGETPQQAWSAIRAQADPDRAAWWIAEGLDASYLEAFDGLYVYKVTHADFPEDYQKASRWARNVRSWEQKTGLRKLWWGTLMPGYDDLRSGCQPDLRGPLKLHKREREDGAFYRATFDAALASVPDGLWINSFNEWVEGTYIEPSQQYGERYLQLTRELAARFKGL